MAELLREPADPRVWREAALCLSHDVLKHDFLPDLQRLPGIVNRNVQRREGGRGALLAFLAKWPGIQTSASTLVDGFGSQACPALRLDRPPLSAVPAETRRWLKLLVAALWESRTRWPSDAEEARAALRDAAISTRSLGALVDAEAGPEMGASAAAAVKAIEELRKAMSAFVAAFARLRVAAANTQSAVL